jgi:hypothetical protein
MLIGVVGFEFSENSGDRKLAKWGICQKVVVIKKYAKTETPQSKRLYVHITFEEFSGQRSRARVAEKNMCCWGCAAMARMVMNRNVSSHHRHL